ncbi:MAG: hypothetical protein L6V91_05670 [Bacilli bacterium]|nr:MAG: hypothetical protein L6V91_05670 [Bacilli bacterium]
MSLFQSVYLSSFTNSGDAFFIASNLACKDNFAYVSVVVILSCPNNSCIYTIFIPAFNKCVALVLLNVCGVIFLFIIIFLT